MNLLAPTRNCHCHETFQIGIAAKNSGQDYPHLHPLPVNQAAAESRKVYKMSWIYASELLVPSIVQSSAYVHRTLCVAQNCIALSGCKFMSLLC